MAEHHKPPRKTSKLVWIAYYDHEKEATVHADDPPGQLAINWSIGWIRIETDTIVEHAYDLSSTGEVDVKRISKRDIIMRLPVIKPRKAREK